MWWSIWFWRRKFSGGVYGFREVKVAVVDMVLERHSKWWWIWFLRGKGSGGGYGFGEENLVVVYMGLER